MDGRKDGREEGREGGRKVSRRGDEHVNYEGTNSREDRPTISEAAQSVQCRHLDHKCKQVIDEGVESLVRHHTPRQVGHRLEFVVDKQLWGHHDETLKEKKDDVDDFLSFSMICLHSRFFSITLFTASNVLFVCLFLPPFACICP